MANLEPIIELSSRASIKAAIRTLSEGDKDVYIRPILQPKREVSSRANINENTDCIRER
jgi:hypothetical protein